MAVEVGGSGSDGFADLGYVQNEGAAGAKNSAEIVFPGVGDRAQAIGVAQGVGRGEGLALSRSARDGDAARRGFVDVVYGEGQAAGNAGTESGVGGDDIDGVAGLGFKVRAAAGVAKFGSDDAEAGGIGAAEAEGSGAERVVDDRDVGDFDADTDHDVLVDRADGVAEDHGCRGFVEVVNRNDDCLLA